MSREAVDIVRAYNEPLAGVDVVPMLEEAVELYEREGLDAVAALQPEMSALVDDDIEWDMGTVGLYRGREGLLQYWREWTILWESYVYDLVDVEDLGECVLSAIDVQARGRQGISVEMRVFQAWEVRDGRIAWSAAFADRQGALDAAAARSGA